VGRTVLAVDEDTFKRLQRPLLPVLQSRNPACSPIGRRRRRVSLPVLLEELGLAVETVRSNRSLKSSRVSAVDGAFSCRAGGDPGDIELQGARIAIGVRPHGRG
jgi:hypothetical protein